MLLLLFIPVVTAVGTAVFTAVVTAVVTAVGLSCDKKSSSSNILSLYRLLRIWAVSLFVALLVDEFENFYDRFIIYGLLLLLCFVAVVAIAAVAIAGAVVAVVVHASLTCCY